MAEADDRDEAPPGAGRPPPPSLMRVLGVGALVLAFVLAAPALFAAGRDLSGSSVVGALALLPPAALLALLYLRLFR